MPQLKTYDLFISHAWKYGSEYDRLVNLLDKANYFKYRNYSAPKEKPLHNLDTTDVSTKLEIQRAIDRKIQPVNAVLVISGMYYNNREWMQYELDTAKNMNKPIIAIRPYFNTKMPQSIAEIATTTALWNTDSILFAIRMYAI